MGSIDLGPAPATIPALPDTFAIVDGVRYRVTAWQWERDFGWVPLILFKNELCDAGTCGESVELFIQA